MEPDGYQNAWRSQSSQTHVTIDAGSLQKAVQSSQQGFRAVDLLGDIASIGSSLLLLFVWIYMGARLSLPWTWYLRVPVFIWSMGLTLVIRARQKHTPSELGGPLLKSVKRSLAQVEHRIWWTRNNFWWYDLPAVIAMLAFFFQVSLTSARSEGWLVAAGSFAILSVFVFAVYWLVYFVNQRVTRKTYEPQRRELLALLARFGDDTTSAVGGEHPEEAASEASGEHPIEIAQTESVGRLVKLAQVYDQLRTAKDVVDSPRRRLVATLVVMAFVGILLFVVAAFLLISWFVWWAYWKILTDM